MPIKKAQAVPKRWPIGLIKLADAIQHNASVSEATRFAGVSRQTYYYYLDNNSVFSEKMAIAKRNQDKLVMSSLTTWCLTSCFCCILK